MSNTFKLNSKGIRTMLRSDDMYEVIKPYADAVQSRAGNGFVVERRLYPERTGAVIKPDTSAAWYMNLKLNILLKALGGKR